MYFWVCMLMASDCNNGSGHAVQPVKGSILAGQFTFTDRVVFVINRIMNNENTNVCNFFVSINIV